jgi:hypothetical protein
LGPNTNEFLYGIDGLLLPNYLFIPGFMLYKEHTNTKEN